MTHQDLQTAPAFSDSMVSIDLLPMGYQCLDSEGYILDVNARWLEIFGYKRKSSAIGKLFNQFLSSDEKEGFKKCFEGLKESGFHQDVEMSVVGKGGKTMIAVFSGRAESDDDGNITKIHCMISDVQSAEKRSALEKKETFYRLIADNATDMISKHDLKGQYLFVSPVCTKLMGYASEELVGTNAYDHFHPEDIETIRKSHDTIMEIDQDYHVRYRLRKKSGEYIWVETNSKVMESEDGKEILAITRDITAEKRVDEALRESEDRLRTIFNQSFQFAVILDKAGKIIDMNDMCYQVCGPLAEKSMGKPFWEADWWIEFPEVRVKTRSAIKMVQKESTVTDEVRFYDKDLNIHCGTRIFSPIKDKGGKLSVISVVGLDITEGKRAEEKLKYEIGLRETLLDYLPCIAMILEKGSRVIVHSNKVAQDVGAIPGKTCHKTCSGLDFPCHWCLAPEVWETNETRRTEIEWQDSFYEGIWVPLTDELYVHYIFNITERKKTEKILEQHKLELQNLSAKLIDTQEVEKKHLARELHDELGQAITAMRINIASMQRELMPNESAIVDARLKELGIILDDLLDQIHEMVLDLRPSLLDDLGLVPTLRWFVERSEKRLNIPIHIKLIQMEDRLDPNLETTIYRIVQEALTNVAKHAQAQSVKVSLKRDKRDIIVKVVDDGKGFNPQRQKEIDYGHPGVGLIGMKERIASFNGTMKIKSSHNKGTTLIVQIPWREK